MCYYKTHLPSALGSKRTAITFKKSDFLRLSGNVIRYLPSFTYSEYKKEQKKREQYKSLKSDYRAEGRGREWAMGVVRRKVEDFGAFVMGVVCQQTFV